MVGGRFRSPRLLLSIALAATLAVPSLVAAQTVVEVDDDNCPGPGTGTPADPYCKIQDAICAIKDTGGGTVQVHPGSYNESLRMFAGVDVISTSGPGAPTIIDGSGQPCTRSDCTPNPATSSCSTVVYGFEGGNARLEGFRITGGAGIFRVDGGTGAQFVAGGGVFLVGELSPTITNNEISGNVMSSTQTDVFLGAGIYVEGQGAGRLATPIITNNVIENNVADPPDGVGAASQALGGGIYLGQIVEATIDGNTIRNNQAGSAARTNQKAAGGGIAVYSFGGTPVISRNVIEGNTAADTGAGVLMGEGYTVTQALIENNVIQYNDTAGVGGGAYTGTTVAKFRSNTIVDNAAELYGGGVYVGVTSLPAGAQATLVNNLVVFNSVRSYYAGLYVGGGLYVNANPLVSYNDLFGNTPDNVGGQKRDPDYIGQFGNVSQDPLFANRAAIDRDLRLTATSPVLDIGDDVEAPATDKDGAPRIVDGNGDLIARIDPGAYEFDPNAADFDQDGIPDVTDPDDDNDGALDGADCAPFNASVSQVPAPIGATLTVDRAAAGNDATLNWRRSFQGHVANVYRGTITAAGWTYDETCFDPENPDTTSGDAAVPLAGEGYYYLVSAKNVCGETRIGQDNQGGVKTDLPPPVPPCADQGLDNDLDGVPDLSDNCALVANADQADADLDFQGDLCDCAPNDASNGPPVEVSGVTVNQGVTATEVAWVDLLTGRYDVAGGLVSEFGASGTDAATCLADDHGTTLFEDARPDPAAGDGYYYLVRAQNSCVPGTGTYGTDSNAVERQPTAACP